MLFLMPIFLSAFQCLWFRILLRKINENREGPMWLAPEVGFGHVFPESGLFFDQALEATRRPNNSGKLPTDFPSLALTKNTRAASVLDFGRFQ